MTNLLRHLRDDSAYGGAIDLPVTLWARDGRVYVPPVAGDVTLVMFRGLAPNPGITPPDDSWEPSDQGRAFVHLVDGSEPMTVLFRSPAAHPLVRWRVWLLDGEALRERAVEVARRQ